MVSADTLPTRPMSAPACARSSLDDHPSAMPLTDHASSDRHDQQSHIVVDPSVALHGPATTVSPERLDTPPSGAISHTWSSIATLCTPNPGGPFPQSVLEITPPSGGWWVELGGISSSTWSVRWVSIGPRRERRERTDLWSCHRRKASPPPVSPAVVVVSESLPDGGPGG